MNGISFSIAIGSWGGINISFKSNYWRLCLGFIAFQLWFMDIENFIVKLIEIVKKQKGELEELSKKI